MTERSRIIKVANYPIGSGPALAYYFEKMNLVQTIDEYVPIDKRRSQLSHGQGVAALVAMVLNHGHALYQMEKWAKNNKILFTIFADIAVNAYTDDRLADTLDALYKADLDIIQWIAALAFVCLIAVQLLRLMEMEAAKALFKSNETLIGLYPNRIATANPNALLMLKALSTIEVIAVHERNSNHRDRVINYMLTSLNPLQRKILALLGVPLSYYSQRKIFMKLKILKI